MIRTISAAILASTLLVGAGAPVSAAETGTLTARFQAAAPATAWTQYYYGRGGYYGRGPSGGEVAAGVIGGLAAGALVGGAIASQQPQVPVAAPMDADMVAYCARKYRSFDPATGTYLARDGQRYVCQ